MKKHRYLALVLALILILTTLPLTALATSKDITGYDHVNNNRTEYKDGSVSKYTQKYIFKATNYSGEVYVRDGVVVRSTGDLKKDYPVGLAVKDGGSGPYYYYTRHTHSYSFRSTRTGHGLACWCGAWQVQFAHEDPLTAEDGRCHCGYKFFDNAQLNVLWMRNVQLTPRFHRDKLEYTGKLNKDVDEITLVTARLFDEMATLEEPASYKLKPGTNVFKFVVTAEDKKTTQTYTVTIEK